MKERAKGGGVRNIHGRALRKRYVCRQRENESLVAKRLLRIRAAQAAGDVHAIARLESRRLFSIQGGADGFNRTGSIRARRVRQRRLSRIGSRAHVGLDRIDADGAQTHDNLSGARLQVRDFLKLQNFRPAEFLDANCLHGCSGSSGFDADRVRANSAIFAAPRNYLSAGDCRAPEGVMSQRLVIRVHAVKSACPTRFPTSRTAEKAPAPRAPRAWRARGNLASGSQRKSWRDTSKATQKPSASATKSSSTS